MEDAETFMEHVNLYGYSGELQFPTGLDLFAKEEPKKLDADQIKKGIDRLKFKHPLKHTPVTKVIPFLGSIKKCLRCC